MLGVLPTSALAATQGVTGARLPGCDAWVGDFASKPDAPAFMRIERMAGSFVVRAKDDHDAWSAQTATLEDVTHDPDLNMAMTHGCVLAGGGALFIKAPKGTAYQATAITGQNFGTFHMATDSLMLVTQGFQVDGRDLYRVETKGVSPPSPPPLAKAAVGKEASSFTCPGNLPPAITQAAFDALPANYREHFHAMDAEWQAGMICGRRLNDLLSLDTYTAVDLQADRASTLAEVKLLLKAGQEPRDEEGRVTWWDGAAHWLGRNTPLFADRPAIPLQADYFATFNDDILPRLPKPSADDTESVMYVARYTLDMPEAQALHALTRLQALGALQLPLSDGNVAKATLMRALSPRQPAAVFELLWKVATPTQKDARQLFLNAIEAGKEDTSAIERLLAHGMDPGHAEVLLTARRYPKPYATLLAGAIKQAQGGKLAPDAVDPLVRAVVTDNKTIDWKAVEPLLQHGGDLSRAFMKNGNGETDSLAYLARSTPERFMDMLDHGLRVDLPYPPGNDALLVRYLRLNIGWLPEGARADVVDAMLKRYNNAATGKPCTDCTYSPISIALGQQGPHSAAVVAVLLRHGVDPNAHDDQGFPYFTYAIMDDRVDMLDAMLQGPKSLNLKVTDPNGFSMLAIARCYHATHAEAWLRQHGADQPDQGYASCRKSLEQRNGKTGSGESSGA